MRISDWSSDVCSSDLKRTVREAAMRRQVYATFMAKPMQGQPGSSMHIHQSLLDKRSGRNLFATRAGKDTALFRSHIAGLQRYQIGRASCRERGWQYV